MTDEKEIEKILQERDKLLEEQERVLENISKNSQQIGKKYGDVVVFAEDAKDQVRKNKEINSIVVKHSEMLSPESIKRYKLLVEHDNNFVTFLRDYDLQLANLNSDSAMVAASGSAMPMMASSSTSGAIYFSIYDLNEPTINKEIKAVQKHIFENLKFIENELRQLFPTGLSDFQNIIKDWFNAEDPKFKYQYMLNLRSIIFYQLFDTLCKEDYNKTLWFKPGSGLRKRFSQAKFFVLGFRDENKFPDVQRHQIDQLGTDMQRFFDEMSNYGKTGQIISNPDVLFENVITNLRIILQLRRSFYQTKI